MINFSYTFFVPWMGAGGAKMCGSPYIIHQSLVYVYSEARQLGVIPTPGKHKTTWLRPRVDSKQSQKQPIPQFSLFVNLYPFSNTFTNVPWIICVVVKLKWWEEHPSVVTYSDLINSIKLTRPLFIWYESSILKVGVVTQFRSHPNTRRWYCARVLARIEKLPVQKI